MERPPPSPLQPSGKPQQATFPISALVIRTLPQELSSLHIFCTRLQQFAVAFTPSLRQSDRQPKRAKFPSAAGQNSVLPVTLSRVSCRGNSGFMSSEPEPGHCGLLRNPPPRQDGSAEFQNLRREPQLASLHRALRSADAMIFRPWRKTAVGSIRDNNAAWVAGPSRICFFRSPVTGRT